MHKALIIAEKPNLDRTIRRALINEHWDDKKYYAEGLNYVSTHSFGHLFTLYDIDDYLNREKTRWSLSELPFIPKEFKYKIKADENGGGIRKQLAIIEKLILRDDIDTIIVAGDSDAEGQNLVQTIIEFVFNKNKIKKRVLRLWFSDQSEPSIRKDMKNLRPNEEFQGYYNQAAARAKVDWLYGINYTRAISLLCSDEENKTLFSSGRVLSSIVKKIYDRYLEQKNFISEKYFNIEMKSLDDNYSAIVKDSIYKKEEQLQSLEVLNSLNSSNTFVKEVIKTEVKKEPKHLFSLTTLQNKANKLYKLSSKETLIATQSLYEKGLVTYPRTDSEYLADNDKKNIITIIDKFKKLNINNIEFKESASIFNTKKAEVHSAIVPTVKMLNEINLSDNERIIYDLVRNRFLSNFCTDECIVEERKVIIANSNTSLTAELKGIRIVKRGFLIFEDVIKEKEVPILIEGDRIKCKYILNECMTKPPSNITLKELNNWMQSPFSKEDENEDERYSKIIQGLQIGTQATRADIIEKAKKLEYIKESKGVFIIMPKGIYLVENTEKLGLLISAKQTATLGKYLKGVFDNKITVEQCVQAAIRSIETSIKNAKNIKVEPYKKEQVSTEIGKCPICNNAIFESNKAFYCIGIKEGVCSFSLLKRELFLTSKGKVLTKSIAKKLIKEGQAKITGLKKKDSSETYDAVIGYKENNGYYNIRFINKEEIIKEVLGKCPRCDGHIIETSMTYKCDNNECSYLIWKEDRFLKEKGIKISASNIKKLIAGKSILIKNIKRNDGKGTYDANMYLNDTGKYVNYNFGIIKS